MRSASSSGRTPAEVVGMSVTEMVHPDDVADAFDALVRLGSGAAVYRLGVRVLHGAGDYIRLEVTGRDLTGDPRVARHGALVAKWESRARAGGHAATHSAAVERGRRATARRDRRDRRRRLAPGAERRCKDILGLADGYGHGRVVDRRVEFLDADGMPVARHRHPIAGRSTARTWFVNSCRSMSRAEHATSSCPVVRSVTLSD